MELAGSWLEEAAMSSGTIAGLGELTTATKLRHSNLRRLQLEEPGHRQ